MSLRIVFAFLFVSFLSGCAVNKMDAQIYPDQDLSKINSFYVVKLDADDRGVNDLIAKKLTAVGKQATTGAVSDTPAQVDAVVTYTDKWMWDITMYMIELTVVIQDPKDKFPIAKGYSMHTSLTRLSPEEMVDEVITNIYKKQTDK
ncbi:hypothetical protein [Cellvibrio sp. NN19]|uniref:hypothetical protein n=1 Tax=Cellvibrio chitinivorans TaxID=3102792 RepID=UPI002B404799|nr:hypothetical protein [Cellvibrio sp. NN19]